MSAPPAWMERVIATIDRYGTTTAATVSGIVDRESLDISIGDKPMETLATLSLGRVYKYNPEEDSEVSFDLYVKDMSTGSGAIDLFFMGWTTAVTSGRVVANNVQNREMFRLTLLFTNDPTPSTATTTVGTTSASYAARRYIFADGFITSYKPSFTDGILKVKCTMKIPPYDGTAVANIGYQSLDGTASSTLTALSTYTGTVKGW